MGLYDPPEDSGITVENLGDRLHISWPNPEYKPRRIAIGIAVGFWLLCWLIGFVVVIKGLSGGLISLMALSAIAWLAGALFAVGLLVTAFKGQIPEVLELSEKILFHDTGQAAFNPFFFKLCVTRGAPSVGEDWEPDPYGISIERKVTEGERSQISNIQFSGGLTRRLTYDCDSERVEIGASLGEVGREFVAYVMRRWTGEPVRGPV